MRLTWLGFRAFFPIALISVLFSACGSNPPGVIFRGSCPISADQRDSFQPSLSGWPAQILIDQNFSDTERSGITQAVSEWNQLFSVLGDGQAFQISSDPLPGDFRSTNPLNCDQAWGGDLKIYLVKEMDLQRWTTTFQLTANNPGVTFRCKNQNSELTQQAVYLNSAIYQPSQFKTIVLHELGHSLGLDHSCTSGGGSATYASCMGLPSEHPYRQALMYPLLTLNTNVLSASEAKDGIRINDQIRAQCLYGPS